MRVVIIDNMNNFGFVLCRYLRDHAIEADLYCLPHAKFNPIDDTSEDLSDANYIKHFPFQPLPSYWNSNEALNSILFLRDYDLVIAQGYSIGFLQRAGIKTDIYLPYGDDINGAFATPQHWLGFVEEKIRNEFISNHYRAISKATAIICGWKNSLDHLGIPYIKSSLPRLYVEEVKKIDLSAYFTNDDFVVVNASRQMWASPVDVTPEEFSKYGGYKRNDRLILGYALFRKQHPEARSKLVIFNYGPDVSQSVVLVKSLGLEKELIVFEMMPRKHLLAVLSQCSVGGDYFGHHIDNIGFQETSHAMLAVGLPLMTYAKSSIVKDCPFFHVESHESIGNVLSILYTNPGLRQAISTSSKAWWHQKVGKGISERLIRFIIYVYQSKKDRSFDIQAGAKILDGEAIAHSHNSEEEVERIYRASISDKYIESMCSPSASPSLQ